MDDNQTNEGGGGPEVPAAAVVLGGVDLGALLALSQQLSENPDGADAVKVSLQSGILEDYFRLMRERAQAVARGLEAQTALSTMAPVQAPPAPEPAAPPRLMRESARDLSTGAAPGQPEKEPTLASFFETVTKAVIDAQREIDTQSLSYARELKGGPLAPVHFSIPNVHAEVKMGFSVVDGSNLLVKLFGKPEEETNYGESTVSFDIAASAPPPGSDFAGPIPGFLAVGGERQRILDELGVPADHAAGAVVLKGEALRVAWTSHDGMVTAYRDAKGAREQFDITGTLAAWLADAAALINAWLASVAPRG